MNFSLCLSNRFGGAIGYKSLTYILTHIAHNVTDTTQTVIP